jgi:DNA-binding response OmpR family regulator
MLHPQSAFPLLLDRKDSLMVDSGMHSGMAVESESDIAIVKIAWILHASQVHPESELLMEYFRKVGFVVEPVALEDLSDVNTKNYPLIIIEAEEPLNAEVMDLVVALRISTTSMIVLLLNQTTSAQVAQALRTGADAVWSHEEPKQVIYARAKALLRRWLSNFHS